MSSIISVAATLGTFTALLLAVFLVIVPSRARVPNVLLALFLVVTAVDISAWFMGEWWNAHPQASRFRPVLSALHMPLFTGFIWLSCFQQRRLRPPDAAHLTPALVVLGFVAANAPMPYLGPLMELQYAVYICVAIFALWRVNHQLRTGFAGRSPSWRWLALLVASSLAAHGLYVVRTTLSPNLPASLSLSLQVLAALLVLAITVWIAFQALLSPNLFRGGDRLLASAAKEIEGDADNERDRLAEFMQEQRPYLDPDLSLSRLARRSGIATGELSALINQRYGLHFFDFINRYRIDHAKSLLADSEQTVSDILYASGFNAKSSFNTAFRKHAGMTPSAYRRTHAKK